MTDEQAMVADTARGFLADNAPVAHARALRDAGDSAGLSRPLWRQLGELGLNGIMIPEADGGLGLGHVEAGVVLEEIGRNLTPSPFLQTAVAGATALRGAAPELRERWFPRMVAGEAVVSLALDEGARHRPDAIACRAERSGNGFRLTGAKRFVAHGHVVDLLIVVARVDDAGLALFAVDPGQPGVTRAAERLVDSSFAATIALDGVEVDGDAMVGGADAVGATLAAVRTGAAAELNGVAAGATAMTLDYLRTRKQFGQEIGRFQALQHRAAHLHSELTAARAATLKAQQLLDAGDARAERAVAVAKAAATLATTLAVQEAVQMHGGIGMTDEHDIGLFMKRARVLAELGGDADFHADALARLSGY
nr:acyl-CoA dehydrogenase [Sphingomonas jejuensis]